MRKCALSLEVDLFAVIAQLCPPRERLVALAPAFERRRRDLCYPFAVIALALASERRRDLSDDARCSVGKSVRSSHSRSKLAGIPIR